MKKKMSTINMKMIVLILNDFIVPNLDISIKPRDTILMYRKLRSYRNHFNKFILFE